MRKKRGSILIYVMTIFAVLMVMGATLTALTLQSMKNRKYYSNNRINLYYSESGIDEAYGIATEYVKLASNDAINKTNIAIEAIIMQDKIYLEEIFYMRETLNYTEEKIDSEIEVKKISLQLFTKFGNMIEWKLDAKQKYYFNKYYGEFFILDKKKNIEKLKHDIKNNAYSTGESGVIEVEVSKYDVNTSGDFTMNMSIRSKFTSEGIEKIISTTFKFALPTYGSKISFPTQYTTFPESPIWNNGITVNKSLSIGEAAKLKVTGDVYAKGEEIEAIHKEAILMNFHDSELIVDSGKVIACEGVKFDYDFKAVKYNEDKFNGAKITIDGSLYTKGILFNKESDQDYGAQGAGLYVTNSIYVLDDCEIDSKKSTVDVVGSYYGVSDGEDSPNNKVDNSSSIIINSEDLGDGSTVNIGDKVYLAGTAYIKGLNNPVSIKNYNYETGESISIKGNYKAYSGNLNSSYLINNIDLKYELEKTMLSPLVLATHYDKYSKWFTLYTGRESNGIYFGMDNQLKEKYKKDNWTGFYKINANGLEDKVFEIGKRESVEPGEIDAIRNAIKTTNNNNKELCIQLVKEVEGVFEPIPDTDMDVCILQEDIEAFLYVDNNGKNNIFVTITPKGEMDSSYNETNDVYVDGNKGYFNKFIQINNIQNNKVPAVIKNRGNELFNQEIELLSYSSYFQNFNVNDKSKYFKQFYEDYKKKNIIHEGKGITIGNVGESIYTGAIISEAGADSTNYGDIDNNFRVGQKKAELKDKLLYMDMFEKKYFNGQKDAKYSKDLGDFELGEYIALLKYSKKDLTTEPPTEPQTKKPPEHEKEYKITPGSLLDSENIEDVDSLDTGLYISTADKTVLTTNENSGLSGTKVILDNNSFGVILCKGDVYIEGDFIFTGTIITLGNVYVVDGSNVEIYYDDTLVKKVVAMNYNKLKNVFVNLVGYEQDTVKIEVYKNNVMPEPSVPLTIERWVVVK